MKYKYLALIAVILLTFFFYNFSARNSSLKTKEQKLSVAVCKVQQSKISTELESIGTAISNESADILSNVTQFVSSIHFSDCEKVKKGQLLVQLNVDKKNAEKKEAEADLKEQERELKRLEILKNKKLIQAKDYDIQYTSWLKAKARFEEIEADLKEYSIVAPFDGILGIRKISVGALLNSGSVVTTIDNVEKIKVDFTVPEKYNLLLKKEMEISAESIAAPNKKFSGVISAVVPRISTISRSISVRGIIDNSEMLLRPGMMLKVYIKLKDRMGIQIPEKALSSIGERYYVFTLNPADEKSRVKLQEVSTGERKNGFVEITGGLSENETIVSDGLNKLTNGALVEIVRDDSAEIAKKLVGEAQ